jgi:ribosomal protein L32
VHLRIQTQQTTGLLGKASEFRQVQNSCDLGQGQQRKGRVNSAILSFGPTGATNTKKMTLRMFRSAISSYMFPRVLLSSEPLSSSAAGRWSRSLQSSPILPHRLLRPAVLSLNLPGIISGIWDSVLRAVPKKKTSHMKKRHRQMAGKALKDLKNLNTCSGCGRMKRAHVLCPHCVEGMFLPIEYVGLSRL